jgi:hypothetical protein
MPNLCRTGLARVAMIACVNPHANDYDETLTVLGTLLFTFLNVCDASYETLLMYTPLF